MCTRVFCSSFVLPRDFRLPKRLGMCKGGERVNPVYLLYISPSLSLGEEFLVFFSLSSTPLLNTLHSGGLLVIPPKINSHKVIFNVASFREGSVRGEIEGMLIYSYLDILIRLSLRNSLIR